MLTPWHSTLIGCLAPITWATVAMMVVMVGDAPPLEMLTVMMATAAITAFLLSRIRAISFSSLFQQPIGFYLTGTGGLFGFFICQFLAFRNAPPVEVFILINLWPLMMLALTFLMYKDVPNRWHIFFSLAGVFGVVAVAWPNGFRGFSFNYYSGLLLGLAASFFWAGYSVINRRYRNVPLDAIAVIFAMVALLAGISHLLLEETVLLSLKQWLLLSIIGFGPEGLALYAWSHGVQNGDLRTLSVVSYLSPILGALLLILFAV